MIKIENVEVGGLKPALRGMRNPKNSWARSDSALAARIVRTGIMRKMVCFFAKTAAIHMTNMLSAQVTNSIVWVPTTTTLLHACAMPVLTIENTCA